MNKINYLDLFILNTYKIIKKKKKKNNIEISEIKKKKLFFSFFFFNFILNHNFTFLH
jgi:hypothetical protein